MIHCLHGAVGNAKSWDLFKGSLGEELIPHDLWKLFKNAPPSLPEAGQIIADQAAQNDILLGYSMGGRLALHALLASPQKWRAAVIISAHPGLTDGQKKRLSTDQDWSKLALSDWDQFLTRWNQQNILPKTPHGFQAPNKENQAAIAQSFHHWSLGTQKNLLLQFQKITCPVLWITGEQDKKFTAIAQNSISLLPHAIHTLIPDCGHRVPWESPQKFAQIVQDFLQDLNYRIHPNP